MEAQFIKQGSRCSLDSCNQFVYLPFTCDQCGKKFCEEHRLYAEHQCEIPAKGIVPVCPKCSSPVPILGQSRDQALATHIASGCQLKPSVPKCQPCGMPSCRSSHPFKVTCHQCRAIFCVSHRLPEEHNCPVPLPKESPSRKQPSLVPASSSCPPPSAGIIGPNNVHIDDQVQFLVYLPELPTGPRKELVFMPKRWSIGKAVDWLCEHFKVVNTIQKRHRFVTADIQAPQVVPNHMTFSQANAVADNGTRFPDIPSGVVLIPEEWLSAPAAVPLAPAERAAANCRPASQSCGMEESIAERLRTELVQCLGQ